MINADIPELTRVIILCIAGILGMCIFSFLNVLIYRIPLKIQFVKGRSFCPSCKHQLKAIDLVPVFSYLFLGQKCRYCGNKISVRYMIVELLGALTGILCILFYSDMFSYTGIIKTSIFFCFYCVLTVVSFIDFDTMEISNGSILWIIVLAILYQLLCDDVGIVPRLVGLCVVSVPLLLLTMVISGAFGGGDIKLIFAIGGFLGYKCAILTFFIAVVLGGLSGVILLARKKLKRKDHFAFGPYICIGAYISALWGKEIIAWYFDGIS